LKLCIVGWEAQYELLVEGIQGWYLNFSNLLKVTSFGLNLVSPAMLLLLGLPSSKRVFEPTMVLNLSLYKIESSHERRRLHVEHASPSNDDDLHKGHSPAHDKEELRKGHRPAHGNEELRKEHGPAHDDEELRKGHGPAHGNEELRKGYGLAHDDDKELRKGHGLAQNNGRN
jgi:hypothetical protein